MVRRDGNEVVLGVVVDVARLREAGLGELGAGLGVGLVRCTSSAGTTKKWLFLSYS